MRRPKRLQACIDMHALLTLLKDLLTSVEEADLIIILGCPPASDERRCPSASVKKSHLNKILRCPPAAVKKSHSLIQITKRNRMTAAPTRHTWHGPPTETDRRRRWHNMCGVTGRPRPGQGPPPSLAPHVCGRCAALGVLRTTTCCTCAGATCSRTCTPPADWNTVQPLLALHACAHLGGPGTPPMGWLAAHDRDNTWCLAC